MRMFATIIAALLCAANLWGADRPIVYSLTVANGGTNGMAGSGSITYGGDAHTLDVSGSFRAAILLQSKGVTTTNAGNVIAFYALSPDGVYWNTARNSMAVTNVESGTNVVGTATTFFTAGFTHLRLLSISTSSTNAVTNIVCTLSVTK